MGNRLTLPLRLQMEGLGQQVGVTGRQIWVQLERKSFKPENSSAIELSVMKS